MRYNSQQLAALSADNFRKYYNSYVSYYKGLPPEKRQTEQQYATVMQTAYKARQQPQIELEYAPEPVVETYCSNQQTNIPVSKKVRQPTYTVHQPAINSGESNTNKAFTKSNIKLMPKWQCILGATICFLISLFLILLIVVGFSVNAGIGIMFSAFFIAFMALGFVCCKQYIAQKSSDVQSVSIQEIVEDFKSMAAKTYTSHNFAVNYDGSQIEFAIWAEVFDTCVRFILSGQDDARADWNSITNTQIDLQNTLRTSLLRSNQPTTSLLFAIVKSTNKEDVLLAISNGEVTYDATSSIF